MDADRILFTTPGLHEDVRQLEEQLLRQLRKSKDYSQEAIVVYGSLCYVTPSLSRDIDDIISEAGGEACRVDAKNCIDMLASVEERRKLSGGKKVYWLPPGWFKYSKRVFKKWDKGMANETFPQHDKAVMLDSIGLFEHYSINSPEKILEFSDWMGIPLEPANISLDRLKALLSDCIRR